VLSTLRYFRKEYEAHIIEKRCPAVVCKDIISSPCQHVCPIETDVPAYVTLIGEGKYSEALELIRMTNPLPAVCGRVCHHPCESMCRRGDLDEPISIRTLKRVASDFAAQEELSGQYSIHVKKISGDGKKVAIVGGGPAGLTAAHYLGQSDFSPVIFEAQRIAGGMLTLGIPEYRLPRDTLQHEINAIEKMGAEIHLNTPIGEKISFEQLRLDYEAVFVATGAHVDLKMGIPGEDAKGVYESLSFLRKINLGEKVPLGKKVAVVGGGNTAIDATRVALRMGADVTILYRRTRKEMPADDMEIEEALHEGANLELLVAPVKVLTKAGKLTGVECIRMELGEPDSSGRRRPVPMEGSEFELELDNLIVAVSGQPDLGFLGDDHGLSISKWNSIDVHPYTQMTNVEGVFAGGDVVTGPWMVIDAIAAGKRAAAHMELFLNGEEVVPQYSVTIPNTEPVDALELTEEDMHLVRPGMPTMELEKRLSDFAEVEFGYTKEMAVKEARRCLRCDTEE
jgi:NADH-quinone oxidoreductase subunit F